MRKAVDNVDVSDGLSRECVSAWWGDCGRSRTVLDLGQGGKLTLQKLGAVE